jgi:glycosyltransferase involved in cell wall biosynthesis
MKLKVVQLTTDNRTAFREYHKTEPWFGMAPESLLSGFAGLQEMEVHVVSCTRQPVRSPEKLADNIWFHSLHVARIGWMRTLYQGCIRAVRRRLRTINPDIVHGQGTECECAIAAALSGFPNVVTLHGIMSEMAGVLKARPGSFYWFAAILERYTVRRTGGVFCNSRHTEEAAKRYARRTWRVPNPLRREFFEVPPVQAPAAKRVLLNVGAVYPNKRQIDLLTVARRWRAEGLDFELHFAGKVSAATPYGEKFLREARAAEQEGWVRYLGFVERESLLAGYDQAAALVHVPAAESFGLVVAEALARNLKFFGFGVGGVPDIAAGVEKAELFEDGDWEGLFRAVRRWIHEGSSRPTTAAQTMRDRYHPVEIACRHLEIYQQVLTSR